MTEETVKNISIVFIGAGHLATNLAQALYQKGFSITQIYSRTEVSAKTLALTVRSRWTTELDQIDPQATLYIVSLRDSVLAGLLPRMTHGKRHALWVHTAGSIPMRIWEGSARRYGVLYPLQTFSKQRKVDFCDVPFFIEACCPEDAMLLTSVASSLSSKVYQADSEQRKSLHLAAVFACNFTNHMYVLAFDLLKKYGLPFDVLLSLIDETARKVHDLSPSDAQTGPAVRFDRQVIAGHLQMLSGDQDVQAIYRMLSDSIHQHALSPEAQQE